jgi:hypothetical protein
LIQWSNSLLFIYFEDNMTHPYRTRAKVKAMAEQLENENRELKEEVSRLSALVESLLQAQKQVVNVQASASNQAPEVAPTFIPALAMGSVNVMPSGYPWGMPHNFMPEGYHPQVQAQPASSPVPMVPPPVVNSVSTPTPIPQVCVDETIYHSEAFKNPNVYDILDEMSVDSKCWQQFW